MTNTETNKGGAWLVMAVGLALVTLGMAGCSYEGDAWNGIPLGEKKLKLHSKAEGVYPDKSVLADPQNPFAVGGLSQDSVWKIEAAGDPVISFYAWATLNARGPTGERQYYTAAKLHEIQVSSMAVEGDMILMKDLAIAAYQSMLDNFPDAVTYDSTGKIAYELATPAVVAIDALGGQARGWVLVKNTDDTVKAVRQ